MTAEEALGAIEELAQTKDDTFCHSMCGPNAHDENGCTLMLISPAEIREILFEYREGS
jgi:hypothetical protein